MPSVRIDGQNIGFGVPRQSGSNTWYALAPAEANSTRPSPSKSAIVGGPPLPTCGTPLTVVSATRFAVNTCRPWMLNTFAVPPEITATSATPSFVARSSWPVIGNVPKSATATWPLTPGNGYFGTHFFAVLSQL